MSNIRNRASFQLQKKDRRFVYCMQLSSEDSTKHKCSEERYSKNKDLKTANSTEKLEFFKKTKKPKNQACNIYVIRTRCLRKKRILMVPEVFSSHAHSSGAQALSRQVAFISGSILFNVISDIWRSDWMIQLFLLA